MPDIPIPPPGDPVPGNRIWNRRIKDANGNPSTTIIFYRMTDKPINLEALAKDYASATIKNIEAQINLDEAERLYKYAQDKDAGIIDREMIARVDNKPLNLPKKPTEAQKTKALEERFEEERAEQRQKFTKQYEQKKQAYSEQAKELSALESEYNQYSGFMNKYTDGKTITRPPAEVQKEIMDSLREAEGVADIKFFNLDALTKADKAFLNANRVIVPTMPDQVYGYMDDQLNGSDAPIGFSGSFYAETETAVPLLISKSSPETWKQTIRHELMHALGLNHLSDNDEDVPKGISVSTHTIMMERESRSAFQPKTLQEWEVEALVKYYEPSKNPSALIQMLDREEKALESVDKEIVPAIEKKLRKLTKDGKLSDKDLAALREFAGKLRTNLPDSVLLDEGYWRERTAINIGKLSFGYLAEIYYKDGVVFKTMEVNPSELKPDDVISHGFRIELFPEAKKPSPQR